MTDSPENEPMIDIYWNENYPESLYYLTPKGFFCLGGLSVVRANTTTWSISYLIDNGFERIGEL